MISIAILFIFLSFYMFYNTSKRAVKYIGFGFENWLSDNLEYTKILATFLCICSLALHIISFGILLFFIVFMTLGSIIILLTPLKLVSYKSVLLIFSTSLFIEFFVF